MSIYHTAARLAAFIPAQISVRRGRQSPAKDVIKMIRKRVQETSSMQCTLVGHLCCVACIVRLLCSAVCLQGSVGKLETVDNAGDDDESAAKRLKSDDADKTGEAATNEQ